MASESEAEINNVFSNVSGYVGLYSRYVGRGRMQADDSPGLHASINYARPLSKKTNFFAGVWGSNTDFNDGNRAKVELDIYGGITHTLDKLTLRNGLVGFVYPGTADRLNYDFYELLTAATYDFDVFTSTATLRYSPDFFGSSGDSLYYTLEAEAPMPDNMSANVIIGRQESDQWYKFGFRDYNHWGAGVKYHLDDGIQLSVDYKNTDISRAACPKNWCDALFVLGISKHF